MKEGSVLGKMLGENYEIKKEIGKGGSGTVYKAVNRRLGCYVAIKEFHSEDKYSEREIELLKELKHPALPNIMDYVEEQDRKYLIMEYIEGMTLENYVKKYGCIEQEQALRWAKELAEVLNYLHRRNDPVIYRDMKPANVMINDCGEVRLIDFGSAYFKYEDVGPAYVCTGTYGYAAPEQFGYKAGECVDERSDIYGLGATLHYMLTGSDPSLPPFMIQPLRFYNTALSSGLEKIVMKATEKEKKKRYQNIWQMEEALIKQRKKGKRKGNLYASAEFIYYFLLFALGGIFLKICELSERYGGNPIERYGKKALGTGILIASLCLVKSLFDKMKIRSRKNIRQVKAVYLSVKKNRGLIAVCLVPLTLVLLVMPCMASAKEELFPVTVRNEKGQKLIIRYDAVYCPEGDIKLEVPADSFAEGEEYVLKLECVNLRTEETRSRTICLKIPKP